jgi:hypothetical protein
MPSTVAFAPTLEDLEDFPFEAPIVSFAPPPAQSEPETGLGQEVPAPDREGQPQWPAD